MSEEAIVYTGPEEALNSGKSGAVHASAGRTARTPVPLHDQDFWVFRDFPLRLVVPMLLLAALAAWVAMVFRLPLAAVIGIGLAVAVAGLAPVRHRYPRSLSAIVAGAMA